ncbi:MAG: hypothetical protein L0I48_07250 [Lactococcus plantarum]|nr:hypothetical protein [Lactococcus plantarum]
MKLPKCMTASFEESLSLLDDSFVKHMISDLNKKSDLKDRPILTGLFSTIFLFLLYIIVLITEKGVKGEMGYSTLEQPKINFIPIWLFYLLLLVWLFLVIMLKKKRSYFLRLFIGTLHVNNYIIWLLLEINLFFLTFFFIPLTTFGVIIFFSLITLIGYAVFRSKSRSLSKQLFNTEIPNDKLDDLIQKMMKFFMKYGWIAVIGVVLWKFIFPNTTGVRTDIVGFIGVIAMWFVMDVAIIVAEAYLFLPYLLYGYYKYKYPEEYRKWENKSQLAWYGEKYFNKHIKGTELEEKTHDGN